MARTTITLLGAPRVEHDGLPVEVDTRKATALVAYLAVSGRRHTRDALAGLLWPEYNQARSRAALRRTLSSLKGARSEGWLLVDREGVDLARDGILVDVDRFRGLLSGCRDHGHPDSEVCPECLPLLGEAVALHRDDFMAGFGLRDSVAFDDWQFFQAESLRRELAGALERLARGLAAREEWESAISHARRWLALDPLHEPAHRLLLELYAWSGQRAAALRQYRECVKVLGKELGVAPLEETTLLYRAVQENDLPAPPVLSEPGRASSREKQAPSPVEIKAAASPPDNPLVGRDREWDALIRSYGEIERGGRLVMLEGEAGIGKTRLSGEFTAHVEGEGASVVAARCYPGETNFAYGPFVEALCAALGREGTGRLKGLAEGPLGEAARLMPDLAGLLPEARPLPPLDTPGARSRFYEGVIQVLLAVLGGPSPGVLFLDDVHWADEASLGLLTYLVRRLEDRPLLVLVTWRPEEVPEHHLRGLLAEARRSGVGTTLTLGRLDPASVRELVARRLGDAAEDMGQLVSRLGGETEGLPLFLAEYLTSVAEGELRAGDAAWAMPGGVQDLLEGRLRTVGETAAQVLAAAAVVGRSFDFDTVREASGRGEEETLASLEELVSRGLIREKRDAPSDGPTYDFDHDKLRTLVYEGTGLARRRLLHRRAAAALAGPAKRREPGPLADQIARHHRLAGQDAEAAAYHRLAGDHARGLYANGEALAHYEEALALGYPDAAALHEVVGDLRTRRGEYGAALEAYELAAASSETGDTAGLEHKIGAVHARRGDRDLARSHYESALESLTKADTGTPGKLARLYADLSLLSHQQDEPERATRFAHQALELAQEAGDARARAQAHNMLGILAGDGEAALRHLGESLDLAEALGDPESEVAALNNLALALGARGEIGEALETAGTALELCVRLGDRHREAALRNNLADLLHAAGREEESMAQLKQAVEIFVEVGEGDGLQPEIWKLVEW
ncbi:AAA family ATPase [Rubrobacter tropicus]|uniref:AAA family ATPase n=1 Tax=Rubrobacter tropicus TaxID=2653851 RepID=A0A6G8QBG8_9ACTN|nr:AAA family ATPase [Rubrobacter tropicus]QIN83830.1 AAA family ATPase [Rubrobacter tropicus]